eukprot:TRINITY_DN341_c0_g1_i4.p1 TRINITY_DN341_c0_g1~~TRINITY_DN341_c0_g1_i4.p1  ORF type:complete len:357 (+),score=3.43 TRINITY_DN341_c0_g1_i4:166-1236(+)
MSSLHSHGTTTQDKSLVFQCLVLIFCVIGIWASYLTQGVVQENLSTKLYDPDGARFEYLTFLNFAQSLVCFFWGSVLSSLWTQEKDKQPPLWVYWSPSVSNSVGPALGLIALKYISYPAQVLAKSSKMIPVMLAGAIIYGVRYTLPEYICTILVAAGVSSFALFKSSSKAMKKIAHPNPLFGYTLCLINLALDGFTNATQVSITHRYPKCSAYHLMMGMNLWGTIYMILYSFIWPWGGGFGALTFCRSHPQAATDILLYCLCGAVGQNFIFLTINKFGALVNTTVTTTRKFMSILISAIWTGNSLTSHQWGGVSLVFSGLSLQIYLKWKRMRQRSKKLAFQIPTSNGQKPEAKKNS